MSQNVKVKTDSFFLFRFLKKQCHKIQYDFSCYKLLIFKFHISSLVVHAHELALEKIVPTCTSILSTYFANISPVHKTQSQYTFTCTCITAQNVICWLLQIKVILCENTNQIKIKHQVKCPLNINGYERNINGGNQETLMFFCCLTFFQF